MGHLTRHLTRQFILTLLTATIAASSCSLRQIDNGHWQRCNETNKADPVPYWCLSRAVNGATEYRRRRVMEYWQGADNCSALPVTRQDALALLSNRRIVFIGDSTSDEMAMEMIAFLEGSKTWLVDTNWLVEECNSAIGGDMYMHPWVHFRYFSTERSARLIPALSSHNISISFFWNGHHDVCLGGGNFLDMIANHKYLEKLSRATLGPYRKEPDVLILGLGSHFNPQFNRNLSQQHSVHLAEWRRGLGLWMDWAEAHTQHPILKDITPHKLSLTLDPKRFQFGMQTVLRDVFTKRARSAGGRWELWPIANLLTASKALEEHEGLDHTHCSHMHGPNTIQQARTFDFRTPLCLASLQLLLSTKTIADLKGNATLST